VIWQGQAPGWQRAMSALKHKIRASDRTRLSADPAMMGAMTALRHRVSEIRAAPSPTQGLETGWWESGSVLPASPSAKGSGAPRSSLGAACKTFDEPLTSRLSVGVFADYNEFGVREPIHVCCGPPAGLSVWS
jgi:hypothetical protein